MQFNSEANNLDLISDITFLLSGIDTNEFTLKDRTRSINAWLGVAWHIIFESYGGWKFMDDNQSDASTGLPYADQTITSGTSLYALPTGTLSLDAAEIMYSAGTPMRRLMPMTYEEFMQRGGDAAFPSNAVPLYYIPQGDIVRLVPTPNYTLASALRIFFGAAMTNFVYTDTTATPGFASVFHRFLSAGSAWDFASTRGLPKVASLQSLINDYERRMRAFYSKRYKDRFPNRIGGGVDIVEDSS